MVVGAAELSTKLTNSTGRPKIVEVKVEVYLVVVVVVVLVLVLVTVDSRPAITDVTETKSWTVLVI